MRLATLVAMTIVAATTAGGATAQTGEGTQVSVGLGFGSLRCESCDGRPAGISPMVLVGKRTADRLLVAAGMTGWFGSVERRTASGSSEGTEIVAVFSPMVRLYVMEEGTFFLLAGAGFGLKVSSLGRGEPGPGVVIGLGADIRASSTAYVTPFVNAMGIASGDDNATVLQAGLGITTH